MCDIKSLIITIVNIMSDYNQTQQEFITILTNIIDCLEDMSTQRSIIDIICIPRPSDRGRLLLHNMDKLGKQLLPDKQQKFFDLLGECLNYLAITFHKNPILANGVYEYITTSHIKHNMFKPSKEEYTLLINQIICLLD